MKIDLNTTAVSQLLDERTTKPVASSAVSSTFNATQDRTTFHSDRTSVESLTRQALSSPEIRTGRTASLHQAVSRGQYPIDAKRIAHAILSQ